MLENNFDKWTSGNYFIDRFIQETQLNNGSKKRILEWIPYNKLKNIKYLGKGGFSTIYEAIWLDSPIQRYDISEKKLIRNSNQKIAIKSLDKSSNLNDKFLNEVLINVLVYGFK